jgi:hypothetical protein
MTGSVQTKLKTSGRVDIVVLHAQRTIANQKQQAGLVNHNQAEGGEYGPGAYYYDYCGYRTFRIRVVRRKGVQCCRKTKHLESYSEFLHNYPGSIHRSEALALKDDATFSYKKYKL